MKPFTLSKPRQAVLLTLLVLAALITLPVHTVLAAPHAEETPGTTPIFLGETVYREMDTGDTVTYQVSLPEDATYAIAALDDFEAIAFDLIVTDADGNELYNDIFESIELDLQSGTISLEFTAVDLALLWYVVLGEIGAMTPDVDQPGQLPPGSVYFENDVSDPRYAILSVPATEYPQMVDVSVEPGEDDSFFVSAEGGDVGYASITTNEAGSLTFWTHGGDFLIAVEPDDRRSEFTVAPFLSGPPAVLALDEPIDDTIAAGSTEKVYALPLDSTYDTLTVEVDSSAETISITVVDRLYDGDMFEISFYEPLLSVQNVSPGDYYVIVETDASPEDIPITVLAAGEEGEPLATLQSGTPAVGQFEEGDERDYYQFEVTQPGAVITVSLESDEEDTDFDLEVGPDPDSVAWSSYTIGSDDATSFVAPAAGTYYITVISNDDTGEYAITAQEGEPPLTLRSGTAVDGQFEQGDPAGYYQFEVAQPGAAITVSLASDEEDTDFDLEVGLDPESVEWSSRGFDSDEATRFLAPAAGTYYVTVISNNDSGEYVITALEGDLAPAVVVDGLTWGSVDTDQRSFHRLEVTDPNRLLTVVLVGPEGVDLDLTVSGGYDEYGEASVYESAATYASSEIVSSPITEPGIYEVAVSAGSSDGGNYVLLTRVEDPDLLAGQWAVDAQATSQYGDDSYSALQATGAADTPAAGDFASSWAPTEANDGEQSLELTYEHAVVPHAIRIYENYNPGAVSSVEAYDAGNEQWVTLWEGEAGPADESLRVFSPELAEAEFETDTIRVVLDTEAVDGWNEIDAVLLLGRP